MAGKSTPPVNPILCLGHLPESLTFAYMGARTCAIVRPFGRVQSLTFRPSFDGYAYVLYRTLSEAQRARKLLNASEVGGAVLSAALYQPTAPPESANVFVKGLPTSYTPSLMEELFDPQSVVLSSKICVDEENQSLGYGYVQFLTEDMAGKAIATCNGMKLGSRTITVESFIPKAKRTLAQGHTIFVKGFATEASESDLAEIFGSFGGLKSVVLRRVPGLSFAFITFEQRENAQAAIAALHGRDSCAGQWFCSFRVPSEGRSGCDLQKQRSVVTFRLVVMNFPQDFSESSLRRLFAPFGTIHFLKIVSFPSESNLPQCALVSYLSESSREDAFLWTRKMVVEGRPLQVEKATGSDPLSVFMPEFDLIRWHNQQNEDAKQEYLEAYLREALQRGVAKTEMERVAKQLFRLERGELLRLACDSSLLSLKLQDLEEVC